MPFQTPITVKEAVEHIHAKKYLLPAIQREIVWDVDQITRLFDSLMRDYPIGSFLFWHVPREKVGDYQFYEFVRDYHERNRRHNPKANVSGEDNITSILDGQQRLTSLYIGLRGSYAYKETRKRWDNPLAYPDRRLYLNLLDPKKNGEETDMVYDFAFMTDEKARAGGDEAFWFKVGDVLDLKDLYEVNTYLIDHGLMQRPQEQAKFANKTLFKLWSVVHEARFLTSLSASIAAGPSSVTRTCCCPLPRLSGSNGTPARRSRRLSTSSTVWATASTSIKTWSSRAALSWRISLTSRSRWITSTRPTC
jgi:hypothetical protein